MSASVLEGEDLKKVGEQFVSSALSVTGHLNTLLGIPYTTADAQKTYDKVKSFVTKGATDVSYAIIPTVPHSPLKRRRRLCTFNVCLW